MKSYNGFDPKQRMEAFRWLQDQIAQGLREQPDTCQSCGQTLGRIMHHSEDYSKPFGPHIGAYIVCWRCHMMIHCRYQSFKGWECYRSELREGLRFAPTANFGDIKQQLSGVVPPFTKHEKRKYTILDKIEDASRIRRGVPPSPLYALRESIWLPLHGNSTKIVGIPQRKDIKKSRTMRDTTGSLFE